MSDPRLKNIGAYRKEAGAAPVQYVVVDVDNTNGTDDINMYAIESSAPLVDRSGSSASPITSSQTGVTGFGLDDTAGSNRGVALENRTSVSLQSGARGTAILATKRKFGNPARVFVYPAGGFDKVEATPSQAD